MNIEIKKRLIISLLFVILFASACGGRLSGGWADLPGHPSGSVVVYGDSRTGHSMHAWLMEGIASIAPEAVFHTGDLVDDGRVPGDWTIFNSIASQLPAGTPIFPALGNHERESQLYFDNFELPGNERWYMVDNIEGFNFIVLDTGSSVAAATAITPASPQYQWLESQLSSSMSSTDFTVVTFHYPLFSTGQHGSDDNHMAADLVPLFEQYGVDAVFNGHDHNYERSTVNGIRYIVTGGGGAPLRDQAGTSAYSELFVKAYHFCVLYFDEDDKLVVDVWSDNLELIDQFEIVNR